MEVLIRALFALLLLLVTQVNDVHGKVVDDSDRPVPGAHVSLRAAGEAKEIDAACDRKGEFAFTRLAAGTYRIYWQAPHYYEKMDAVGTFPSGGEARPEVTLPANRDTTVTLHMNWTSTLVGRLIAPSGKPLANMTVPLNAPRPEMFTQTFVAKTDRSGAFRLEFPYAGDETFEAVMPGVGYMPSTWFTLTEGEVIRQEFRFRRPASITGEVRSRQDDKPLANAYVQVRIQDPGIVRKGTNFVLYYHIGEQYLATDKNGRSAFYNLPGGTYTLGAGRSREEFFKGPKSVVKPDITVADGEQRKGFVLHL